jgi:PAS domain S-box-containing protein
MFWTERLAILRAALFAAVICSGYSLQADVGEPKRVLVLYSFDKEQSLYSGFDQVLRLTLRSKLPDRVEFYTEYLDLVRFPDRSHADNLVESLRLRFSEKKPDLVIAVSYSALNFLLSNGEELFPKTPIVTLFNERRAGELKQKMAQGLVRQNITGVEGRDDPKRSVDLARQLQPDTQRVFIVVGSSPLEKFWLKELQADFSTYDPRIAITYLTDLSMDEMLRQVAGLPPHSIILFTFLFQDASGQFFLPEEALDLIARKARVPVFGIYLPYLGHGLVGGRMSDPEKTGIQVAELARRVLSGEKPENIPMVVDNSTRDAVNWRELRRWDINPDRVPAGSVVLFREPSLWDRYRWYLIGGIALVVCEAALIFALLIHRRRRRRAEQELRKEKAFSDAVIESLPGVFYLQDEIGTPLRWNKNTERISGYQPSEAKPLGLIADEDKKAVRQTRQEVFEKGSSQVEADIITKDGKRLSFLLTGVRLQLDRPYLVGIGVDITDRKRAEEALRQAEERFSNAFKYAAIGMALVAPDGRFLRANQALCDLLGYSAEELTNKTFQEITHPEDLDTDVDFLRRMLRGEIGSFHTEKRYFHKTGRVVRALLSVSAVRDKDGRLLHFVSQIQDITERKRAEEALRQAEERFSKAFGSSPVGLTISTLQDGRALEVNDAFLQMVGYERGEFIGKTARELRIWVDPEERAPIVAKLLAHRSVREENVRLRTKSGKVREVQLSAEIIQLQNEPCLLAIMRDVTEQNLLEQQLRQAQKMEALGRLAGGIAHDFNNLLGVIIGYSELLAKDLASNPGLRRRVDGIRTASERAASLTAQLLAFSRRQVLQPKVLNLNSIVLETDKMLRHVIGEDIEATTVLDSKLEQVKADPGQIAQVIMNLVVNARDAMPSGGKLTIETANAVLRESVLCRGREVPPGRYVMLSVSDTGIGMDAETQASLFEPFFTTKPTGKGTGLGLATVGSVVERSGGYILVDSEPGKGTTFKIFLPAVDESPEMAPAVSVPAERAKASETVLLVDDDAALRGLVSESLQLHGYNVLQATSSSDAIRLVEECRGAIHLLITDVIMPQMTGPELAQLARALHPGIKVLYISGYTDDKLSHAGVLDPKVALLQKPFPLEELALKLREVLGEKTEAAP